MWEIDWPNFIKDIYNPFWSQASPQVQQILLLLFTIESILILQTTITLFQTQFCDLLFV